MNLEISMGGTQGETFAPMEQTWRNEGLSVGEDHMVRDIFFLHMENFFCCSNQNFMVKYCFA